MRPDAFYADFQERALFNHALASLDPEEIRMSYMVPVGRADPFGQGVEYAELIDVSRLGAIVNKGTTVLARPGNPQYRIAETPSGILNSIGLENPGAAGVVKKYAKAWRALGVPVIVNVAGYSVEDYVTVVSEFAGVAGVVGYELNVSCPNVRGGMLFGCDPGLAG